MCYFCLDITFPQDTATTVGSPATEGKISATHFLLLCSDV